MCDCRGGARTSAGHRVGVITERLSRVPPRGANPFCRSQSRRIEAHAVARELHGNEEPLASSHNIGGRFSGLHAKNQSSSLGRRYAESEKHARRRTWLEVRLAKEHSSLEGNPGKHS